MNLNQGNINLAINTIITLIEMMYIENPELINFHLSVERSPEFSTNKKYLVDLKPAGDHYIQSTFPAGKYRKIFEKEINQIAEDGYQGYTDYFKDMFFITQFASLSDRNARFKIYEQICDESRIKVLKNLIQNWENNDYTPMPVSHFGTLSLSLFFSDFNQKEIFKKHISDIIEQEYQLINLLWENIALNIFSFAAQHQSQSVILTKIYDKLDDHKTVFSLRVKGNPDKEQSFKLPFPETFFRFNERIFETSKQGSFNVFRYSFIDFINTKHLISNSYNLKEHLTEGISLMISQYEQKLLSDILENKNILVKDMHRI